LSCLGKIKKAGGKMDQKFLQLALKSCFFKKDLDLLREGSAL
jgi:hypothetical protein